MNIVKINLRTLNIPHIVRHASTAPAQFINRNPRNLERLRIARKPNGYHLEKPGRYFWHKLHLKESNWGVTAQVVHFINGPVVEAKTSEWALKKQLYSIKDINAYTNLGTVFALRCLEMGIVEMFCDLKPVAGGKVEKFLNEVVKGGIVLQEPEVYTNPAPWTELRPEKPWEVTEDEH